MRHQDVETVIENGELKPLARSNRRRLMCWLLFCVVLASGKELKSHTGIIHARHPFSITSDLELRSFILLIEDMARLVSCKGQLSALPFETRPV